MSVKKFEFHFHEKLSFTAEWSDGHNIRQFLLNFYPYDETLELYDKITGSVFLKRFKIENVKLSDMYPCNRVVIYGRPFVISEYANSFTKDVIDVTRERTLLLFKPTIKCNNYGVIISIIENNFHIVSMRMSKLNREYAIKLYNVQTRDKLTSVLIDYVISGPILLLELAAYNAINKLLELLGDVNPVIARKTSPNSLRARYGIERVTNAFHETNNREVADKEIELFFRTGIGHGRPPLTTKFDNTTLCIIKPHSIRDKNIGRIVSKITQHKFTITMMQIFDLKQVNAEELLEVYMGVVDDFHKMVQSYINGPCLAMEIGHENKDVNVHKEFRMLCGPSDPDVARQVRPDTLRAMFGNDKHNNAVHCTDLEEDVLLELEYFFKLLQN